MAAKIDPATVTIERAPPIERAGRVPYYEKGRKIIKVAGEPYGFINQHQHGGRGNSYTFQQAGGQTVTRQISAQTKFHNARFTDVTVYGDKAANRMRRGDEPALQPIAERLHAKAVELIESGQLISQAAQAERVAERNRIAREAEERRKAEAIDNFDCRARMALAEIFKSEPEGIDAAYVGPIIAAMKWAQTQ
jgi:hypothetical protein